MQGAQTDTLEEIARRRERAEEWIVEADRHIRAARSLVKRDGMQTITLYHVQQSIEKATKGLARASGVPHEELKSEIGHNNLFLFGKIIEIVMDSLEGYEHTNKIIASLYPDNGSYSASQRIKDMLAATASPKQARALGAEQYARDIFTSALRMTPDEVKFMLDSFDRIVKVMQPPPEIHRAIRKLTNEPLTVRTPSPESNWTDDIAIQVTEQLVGRLGKQIDPMMMAIIQDLVRNPSASEKEMADEIETNNGLFHFDGIQITDGIDGIIDMLSANLGLLIIGSLVWAHEAYPRYPAEPGSPDSIEQAAASRKLGVKHYNQDMGVIKHIKPLTEKAYKTISLLKKSHKAGYLMMSADDVRTLRTKASDSKGT